MNTFSRGSRVCFVGDSITHNNRYVAHIAAFYREHFPKLSVEFYNCGISGGSLGSALSTFDTDTAAYKPTHIVLMIGINDSDRNVLNEDSGSKYDRLKCAFDNYKINLDKFCEKVKKINAELTLCTPTPYAEYINSNEPPLRGGSALMLGYADYIKNYAKENGYRIDEMGILALYSRIDMMQREDHAVTVAEVKEIMDEAISHSQKANVKHLVKRVFGRSTDNSDRIILKEEDFKA